MCPTMLKTSLIICFVLLRLAGAYQRYQAWIPNGNRVPNPCNSSAIWQGVGHLVTTGGGVRNIFGIDFGNNNHNWTVVCPMDSDGDGMTNGQELGDPNCLWTMNMPSPNATKITHPGVCEPINSTRCRSINSWLACPSANTTAYSFCPAISQPGVMNISLRLPPTNVPTQQTSYMCYGFVLPNDTDYHVIATAPIITRPDIDHHMLLFVCRDPPKNAELFSRATECMMGDLGCDSLIGIWAVGIAGQCLSDQFGFRIGARGYRYAVIQMHWNNDLMTSNLVDSSGMTLFYTRSLRPNDGGVLMTGQMDLTIPPRQQSVKFSSTCSGRCTNASLTGPIYITDATLHMHLIGVSGDIKLNRNGIKTTILTEPHFDFNAPEYYSYNPAYQMKPGDEIIVDCNYNSLNRNVTTYYGPGTPDEMCFGFLTYYPQTDAFSECLQWRTADLCMDFTMLNCDLQQFGVLTRALAGQRCTNTSCPPTCRAVMQAIVETGCTTGDVGLVVNNLYDIRSLWFLQNLCSLTSATTTPAVKVASTTRTSSASIVLHGIWTQVVMAVLAVSLLFADLIQRP